MYENDLKHGKGEFRWSDGRVLKGTWNKGKQDGEAIIYLPNGQSRKCIWSMGKQINGKNTLIYNN